MLFDFRKITLGAEYSASELSKNEDKIQSDFFLFFWNNYPETRYKIFSIPNGGSRNKIEAAKMKGTGTLSGVWDMCVLSCSGYLKQRQ
jgi:hypothetical protein